MLGFAVVDSQTDGGTVAVWLTGLVGPQSVSHTNAVVVDLEADESARSKIDALVRNRAVLLTDGSDESNLPLSERVTGVDCIAAILEATIARRIAVSDAVDTYAEQSGNRQIVRPEFTALPTVETLNPPADSPTYRALATANLLAKAWEKWLEVEYERRSRTVQPRTGATPWMMPPGLDSPDILILPTSIELIPQSRAAV